MKAPSNNATKFWLTAIICATILILWINTLKYSYKEEQLKHDPKIHNIQYHYLWHTNIVTVYETNRIDWFDIGFPVFQTNQPTNGIFWYNIEKPIYATNRIDWFKLDTNQLIPKSWFIE